MWYLEENYPELETNNRSLLVAFSNLLQKFDLALTPTELKIVLTQDDPIIDWWAIGEYIDGVDIGEITEEDNTWPEHSNAIVKFHRIDQAAAGVVDHYCLVADPRAHSIIDSLDGKIKSASTYGSPVGWASYVYESQSLASESAEEVPANPPKPGTIYTVHKDTETVWAIARKLKLPGLSGQDIADHNDISAIDPIPGGTELHLPIAMPAVVTEKGIEFEVLPEPLEMHVIKSGGTRKYSFGHVKKWSDITPTGPNYPEGANVRILAIAHVPIPEDSSVAAYYMDGLAVGDYNRTGRMSFMVGFNHSHLAEGFVEAAQLPPKPEMQTRLEEAEKALEEAHKEPDEQAIEPVTFTEPTEPTTLEGTAIHVMQDDFEWKSTIQPLNPDHSPVIHLIDEDLTVFELANKRQPLHAPRGKGVRICCTIWKDGECYGLPASHQTTGLLYGFPMDKIYPEDEVFDYGLSEEDRIGSGRLTDIERYWYVPLAKATSHYARFKHFVTKQKPKEKK